MSLFSSIMYSIFVDFNKSSSQKKKKRLMRKQEQKDTSVKVLNSIVIGANIRSARHECCNKENERE